nr:MMPL family transporter [Nonomuraea sp. FMUSA5-5]
MALAALALLPGLLSTLGAPSLAVSGSPSARAAQTLARGFPQWGDEQVLVAFDSRTLRADQPAYQHAQAEALRAFARAPGVTPALHLLPAVPGQDPRHAYAIAGLSGDDNVRQHRLPGQRAALETAARQASSGRVSAALVGVTPVFADIKQADLDDLRTAEMIAAPLTLIVLVLGLGTLGAAAIPLLIASVVIVTSAGVLALAGTAMSANTLTLTVAATVGLGLGLDYALLILLRYRQARRGGARPQEAVTLALATAGVTVTWCGIAVVAICGCGLLLVRSALTRALIAPAAVAAVIAVAAALTLLPAVLLVADRWIERGKLPRPKRLRLDPAHLRERWTGHLMRHPWPYVVGVTAVLLLAAAPATGIRLGIDYDRPAIAHTASGQTLAQIERDGLASLITIPLPRPAGAAPARTDQLIDALRADPSISAVNAIDNGRDLTLITAFGRDAADNPAAAHLMTRIRGYLGQAVAGQQPLVGGPAAVAADLLEASVMQLGQVVALVVACTLAFLLLLFRSVLIPLKAAAMNLLATTAAFGLLTVAFQHSGNGTVIALLPLLCCTVVFSLSLDYEVFLVHRIAEHYRATGDNATAIARGMRDTARTIALAAAVLVVTFASLLAGHRQEVRQIGFAGAAAIALDATLIRLILAPALMRLLGHRNWWFPALPGLLRRPCSLSKADGDPDQARTSQTNPIT